MGSPPEHIESSMKAKFQALFVKINEPNYVMDNYYSDNLIHKIVETRQDHNYIYCLTHLLVEPIKNLEKYHASVQVFLVRLLAFCVSKELYFAKISSDINAPLRKAYSEICSPNMMPSLCVAYLEVALSLVEQCTGLCWLLESGIWKEILSTNNESKTVFVTRQKYKFVSNLVWRLNGLEDDTNLKQVLNLILKPLLGNEIIVAESITADEEEEASKQLKPTLHMLQSILSDYRHLTKSSLVIDTLMNHFKLVTHLYVLLDRFRKDSLMSLISKLIFRLILAKVLHRKPLTEDTIYTAEDFIETNVAYFNTVNLFLTRRNVLLVLDYCYSCNETWNGIWDNQKPNISALDFKKVDVQHKMLFLCLVPALAYITRHLPDSAMQMQGYIQDYIMKLINASCEHTAKTAMKLGELTLELDTEAVVLQSVKRLSSLNNSMNNEQANLMFQGLFYVLKHFEPHPENQDEKSPEAMFQEDQENLLMYTYVIEAIFLLVKNYDIKWTESLEVICLYNVVYKVLKKPNLSNKSSISLSFLHDIRPTLLTCGAYNNYISFISDLLVNPLQKLQTYDVSVQVFLVRLLAVCVRKELYCTKIISSISDSLCSEYRELSSPTRTPSLRVAYLEVTLALVEHCTGLCWLLDTEMWKEILSTDNENNTVFITRLKYKFACRLVWRLNDLGDDANVRQVLNYILKPLIESDIVVTESITAEEEELLSKQFEPMLHMLQTITSEYSQLTKASLVVNALLNHFKLVGHMYVIFEKFRKDSLSSLVANLMMRLTVAKILHYKPLTDDTVYSVEDFVEVSVVYFNTLNYYTLRRNAMLALDYCYACNEVWNGFWHNKKPETNSDGKKVNVQNKMLLLCLVPPLVCITKHLPRPAHEKKGHVQDYIMRLIHATCEHTAKAAIALGDLVLELDTKVIVLKSVKRLAGLNTSMNNEQANLMFQGLFYVLKQFDPDPESLEVLVSHPAFQADENVILFSYVLEGIMLLVKNYDINWQESLEIVSLYNLVHRILGRPNLSTKFVVTALNVIAVTVRKFLPPNLSLLMESKPGSEMHDLGRLIYMKMHDLHWEVRDSALELLLVCTEISYVKFPPFQKQIIENELIVVATAVALNDHEFYVRSSALRCLGAACKVAAVWDRLRAKHPDIQDSLLNVLRHNQEGIVRKEACNVLCEIYLNVKLCPNFKQTLYEQMVSSAVSDFHWEVQLAALKFWKIVINNSLCEQGMLDGTFPPVTFSKESRKIVTLNKAEIQKRLRKILDELAAKGCLTVLTKLLHEDTEVEIMDANLSIALNLLEILKRYEVPECLKPVEGEPRTVKEYYGEKIKEENMDDDDVIIKMEELSDNVIESIVNADDMNLLAHIYESHMKLQNDKPEKPKEAIKLTRNVQPYLFVNHLTSKDFKAVIEYKKQWRNGIRSVESLLDDVLGIYEINQDVNNLDCY